MIIGIDGTPFFRRIDGIGRYSHDLIKAVAGKHPGTQFTILGFRGDTPTSELTDDLPDNVDFFYFPLPRKLYQVFFAMFIALNISRLAPRFDHIIHLNFTLFPYIRRRGTRHTLFVHDTTFVDLPEVVVKKNLHYLRRRVPWSIQRADVVAVISDFTKRRVQELQVAPDEKVRMVGTGVQEIYFKKAAKPAGLPKHYILAIGTLEPRKNLESLVKAHLKLPAKQQKAYPLVLGGSLGWNNSELRTLMQTSPHIHHLGYVAEADLPGLYQHATLFVFPSLYEGFGIPVLEAMASKTPVLANNIELFQSIGKRHITYTDATDAEILSGAMGRLLKSPPGAQKLADGQKQARSYTWEGVADRLWNVLQTEVR